MARIIVADDNKSTQMFYENILGFLGHEYKTCSSGLEVIEEFIKKPADLLILDYQMPTMDVFETCRRLRGSAEGVTVPIIIVSSTQDKDTIMECLDAGATDYLLKPVTEAHLIAKLKNFLNISSLHKKDLDLVKNQTVFAGHYKIEKLLGYGSHSVVFLARDEKNQNAEVAIKMLRESADMETFAPAFLETASKMKKINSGRILKIFDSGQYGGRLYLIMEYASQKDLASVLKIRTLSDRETALLVTSILEALKIFQDNGLVHFDIKPENILIKDNLFKLGDFGIIPLANSKSTISMDSKNIWTTISYLAPENLNISSEQTFIPDMKCDIYSLGVTAYQSFTGDNPFAADKMLLAIHRQLNHVPSPIYLQSPEVLRIFSDAIESMLLKNPEARPNLEELIKAFSGINTFLAGREPLFFGRMEVNPDDSIQRPAGPAVPEVGSGKAAAAAAAIPAAEPHSVQYFRNLPPSHDSSLTSGIQHLLKKMISKETLASSVTVLLALGISAAMGFSIYNVITHYYYKKTIVLPGAISLTICSKCSNIEERRCQDIKDITCSKCGGRLGYARECNGCGRIFPYIPLTIEELPKNKLDFMIKNEERLQCPACKSYDSSVVLTKKEKNELKVEDKNVKAPKKP